MRRTLLIAAAAFAGGVADRLNQWSSQWPPTQAESSMPAVSEVIARGLAFAVAALVLAMSWDFLASLSLWSIEEKERFRSMTTKAFLLPLLLWLGALGVRFPDRLNLLLFFFFLAIHAACYLQVEEKRIGARSDARLLVLFFISGFSALVYQVSWQRILLTQLGANIESVTCIVSVFMIGLGGGALVGGAVAARAPRHLRSVFLCAEAIVGLFGLASVSLLR